MGSTRNAKKNPAGRWFALAAIVCAGHALPAASEEVDARIRHKPVETAWSGVRIELAASIRDVAGVDVARVYFKAEGGANFLFVPMRAAGGNRYTATLPAPSAGVGAIEYRILARNLGGMVYKTQAYAVAVEDGTAAVASDREPLKVFTELAELPDTIHGFTDNIALDVVESAAKYGVVAGLTGEAGAGTAAASVSATGGSTVAASAGLSTVATVGIGAAAAAAVGGVVVAIQEDENRAPEFPAGTLSLDVEEGTEGDIGAPVTATDPDGDALTYSLGGADAGLFEIDAASGQVSVPASTALDFEARASYAFEVVASDGELTATRSVGLSVADVNEAPTFPGGDVALSMPEGTTGPVGEPVTATDPDGDALSYSLGGADAGAFEIDAASGQVSVPASTALDFEARTSYAFEVVASDGDLTATRSVGLSVADVNEAPTFPGGDVALSMPEGTTGPVGEPVTATDPDGDALSYSLGGADAGAFEIDAASGQVSVPASTALDFEARTSYAFEVVASDGELTATRSVGLSVADVNEAPTFPGGDVALSVSENVTGPIGEPVTATDPDGDALTYSLGGADADFFEIDAASGQVSVPATTALDFEARTRYACEVVASDPGGLEARRSIVVTISDTNEAPVFPEGNLELNVEENTTGAIGEPVTATDPDGDSLTYRLEGDDRASFEIDAASGQLSVSASVVLDVREYRFVAVAADPGGLEARRAVVVTVAEQPKPTIKSFVAEPAEITEGDETRLSWKIDGPVVAVGLSGLLGMREDSDELLDLQGIRILIDPGDSPEEAGISGTWKEGSLMVKPEYAAVTYELIASNEAGGASKVALAAVTVVDTNEPPTFPDGDLTPSVSENTTGPIGDPVTATDPDGDALTYSLGGADAGLFEIDATGQLSARDALDVGTYTFDVVATDSGGLEDVRTVVVQVVTHYFGDFDIFVEEEDLEVKICIDALSFNDFFDGKLNGEVVIERAQGGVQRLQGSFRNCVAAAVHLGSNTIEVVNHRGTNDWARLIVTGVNTVRTPLWEGQAGGGVASATVNVMVDDGHGQKASEADWRALVALYRSTDGANWISNENWDLSLDAPPRVRELTSWHGVRMSDGRVAGIFLSHNYLKGSLPLELADLTELRTLDLLGNRLVGSLPAELGRLANLERLSLSSNSLTGPIPPELGRLANLERLSLSSNSLTGPIPPELGGLANLGALYLSDNSLTGPIPPELGGLANLGVLYLSDNSLTGPIPPELGGLANLGVLYLSDNSLTGPIPPELGGLANLGALYLHHNSLTGPIPPELGGLANLGTLYLSDNSLTGPMPSDLTDLTALNVFFWDSQSVAGTETPLCAPTDAAFQDWLATVDDAQGGPNCADTGASVAGVSAPRVEAVSIVSDPGPDGVYGAGEVVEASVRFDRPVTVAGVPQLRLGVGSATAAADLVPAQGEATTLSFRYTVARGDHDADGVSVGGDALRLNGGSIAGADGSAATNLGEHMIANAEGHIVDARVQRAERAILEDALAAQGRAHLASATGVIGDRFRAGPASSPRMTDGRGDNALPNRYDPMDVQALAAGGRGSPFESGAAPGGVAMSGEYGAAQPFQPTGTGPGRGMGSASLGSIFGRNFTIPLGGTDESSGSGWTLWGANDVQTFRGTTANGSHDGDLRSLYLGIDGRIGGDWLAGVALSRSRGETAYGFEVGDLDGEGMLRANLTSIHPYLHGRLSSGLEVWGIAGFGGGEAVLRRDDPVPEEAADLAMGLGALGVRQGLREFGSLKLSLLADAGVARLATDAGAGERTMDGLSALVTRFRVGIEGEHLLTLAGGGSLRPFWQASGRYDGGDGLTGQGMELAAGVRYGSDRWDADIQARWLAVHSSASHEEFGASASLRIKPNASGLGLTAALSPQWGASGGGAKSMWREEILRVSHKVDAQRRQRDPWSMDGRLEYGVALPYTLGVLKPFGEFRLAGETSVRQRLGLRLDRSVGDRSLFGAEFGAALVEHPLKKGSTVAIDLTVEARF